MVVSGLLLQRLLVLMAPPTRELQLKDELQAMREARNCVNFRLFKGLCDQWRQLVVSLTTWIKSMHQGGKPKPSTASPQNHPLLLLLLSNLDKEGHLAKRCWAFLNRKKNNMPTLIIIVVSFFSLWFYHTGSGHRVVLGSTDVRMACILNFLLKLSPSNVMVELNLQIINFVLTLHLMVLCYSLLALIHRHITKTGLTIMFHACVSLFLWVEAFSTTDSHHKLLMAKLHTSSCYSPLHKGFRCFDRKTQRLYVSRHVQFYETIFPYAGDDMQQIHNSTPYITFSDSFESNDNMSHDLLLFSPVSNPNCLPCSDDLHASSHASPIISTILSSSPLSAFVSIPTTSTNIHPMPRGFKCETKHHEWLSAMDDEIQALKKNDTWDLVPRPINHNVVGCRWIFKTKLHANGSIERHKARLVAKGFSQIHGLDFEDTFISNSSLFVHHTTTNTIYLLLYVDDMVLRTNPTLIKTLITQLSKEFAMKDLGSLHYFLSVEVQHNSQGLFLSQTKYALDLLQRLDMIEAKPISTPFVVGQISPLRKLFWIPLFSVSCEALQYLTITRLHHGLQLHRTSSHELLAYYDSIGLVTIRRSTGGYLIFFGANLVSWCSKKQSLSRSSLELLGLFSSFVIYVFLCLPLEYIMQQQKCSFMAVNPVSRSQSKHIAIDYHFVRELIANASCYSFYHTHL
ncbi:hypothetical protein AAG906_033792 [Vitis piasezkii]